MSFKYEQLPIFCFYYWKVGHGERSCGKNISDSKSSVIKEGQFGEWLRAMSSKMSIEGKLANKREGNRTLKIAKMA